MYDEDGQIAQLLRRGAEEKRRLEEEGENKRILEKGEKENYKGDSNFVQDNPQSSTQNKQVEQLFFLIIRIFLYLIPVLKIQIRWIPDFLDFWIRIL